ncbi:MAG: hypothetical protein MR966_15335 [Lachnospiraceae bacterium]|nr:hypothetical protein [Lachnospiraceae bacterium]
MEIKRERENSCGEAADKKILELMDVLCETGVAVDTLARMCSVLKLGFESPDFCDGKDAAACVWVIEQLLEWIGTEKISPEVFKWEEQ